MTALVALAAIPVIIQAGDRSITAESVAQDVAAAAKGRGDLRALTPEELFVSASSELLEEVRGCGADEACMSERLSAVRADLGAIVLINLIADPPLIAVRLVDVQQKRVVGSSIGPLEGETISEAVRRRVGELLEARGHVLIGRLIVQPSPADADISVEGIGDHRQSYELPPGRYVVHVSRADYEAQVVTVDVAAGGETSIFPALEAESRWFESPWLWVGIGAAVIAGVAIAVAATRDNRSCICIGPEDQCPPC